MKLKTAEMSHFWQFLITMPHLSVRKMKNAASWKKNDPSLETRKLYKIAKLEEKNIFLTLDPPSCLKAEQQGSNRSQNGQFTTDFITSLTGHKRFNKFSQKISLFDQRYYICNNVRTTYWNKHDLVSNKERNFFGGGLGRQFYIFAFLKEQHTKT